jgi:predicted DsbA family dithiol-disulfide isomerase
MTLTPRKRIAILLAILLLCAAGAWFSIGLLSLHDEGEGSGNVATRLIARLCSADESGQSGCLASAQSPWSEISLPVPGHPIQVPIAFLAVAYFMALGIWHALVERQIAAVKWLRWVPVAVAMAGIYGSLFYFSLMALGRSPWCGGCVTVHAINLLLVVAIGLNFAGSDTETRSSLSPYRQPLLAIGLAMGVIAWLGISREKTLRLENQVEQLKPYEQMIDAVQNNPKLLIDAYMARPVESIPLRADEIDPAGKHELVIFLDFQCPACMASEQVVRDEIVPAFGGSLNVVVRHYPLCTKCNPNIPRTKHPGACEAAYAAEAARVLGGREAFDRMSAILFDEELSGEQAASADLAKRCGLDADRFVKLLDDPAVRGRVAEDVATAHALGVHNTPTMFLDGRSVPTICETPAFWEAVGKLPATRGDSGAR